MTTYITIFGANKHIYVKLHGYILGGKCKLIAQNQALERVNRGKFSLVLRIRSFRLLTSWLYRAVYFGSEKLQALDEVT
jgi:hypothetical protein